MIQALSHGLRERTYTLQRDALAKRIFGILQARGLVFNEIRVADIGCGLGLWLHKFQRWGMDPARLCGLDISPTRIRAARDLVPPAVVCQAECQAIPLRSSAFDIVTHFTLFSSLTTAVCRQAAAREMLRILKPGGLLIWYDFFAPNPLNRNTRAIRRREICKLFPGCRITFERATLLAPLARLVARFSPRAVTALECIPAFRTHYLATIEKNSTGITR
jgi:ubiquinone/menaquinone biosynthesis C-methylase UbiE